MNFDPDSVLLLIDIQKAYGDVVGLETFQSNMRTLLKKARAAKIPIIHVHEIDDPDKSKWIPFWEEMKGPRTLDRGIPMECALPLKGEQNIIKHGYDAFHQTGLQTILKGHHAKTIYVAGLLTGVCVLNTIMSAFNRGYRIYLFENCCSDRLKTRHQTTLQYYQNYLFKRISV